MRTKLPFTLLLHFPNGVAPATKACDMKGSDFLGPIGSSQVSGFSRNVSSLVRSKRPSERVKRLEERGIIRAFTVDVSHEALGYALQAIVRIRPLPGKLHIVQQLIIEIPEIVECDKVTGDDCYIARLYLRSIGQLDEILDRIADKAETSTSIVKSQPVRRRNPPLG